MFFLLIPVIFYVILKKVFFPSRTTLLNKHVVITGGSSGIGRSAGILAAKQGADVTIIARDVEKLSLAEKDMKDACINASQKIRSVSLDVTDDEAVSKTFDSIEESGPIYMLINCAGTAILGKLEDMKVEDIKSMIDLNIFGTVYPTRKVIPKLKERKEGIIVMTSSQGGLLGIFGMSVYAGTKFAIRGFAEAIDMEVRPHNVSVTVSLPPDTDTPGFENENKHKPEETALISNAAGLFHPDVVAKKLLNDALNKKFFSCTGFESWLVTTVCVGMAPSSILEGLLQSILLGPLRLISLIYLSSFHRIARKCLQNENKRK